MKDSLMLNYNYLFSDHMAKCSDQAKLYYIKLMFFANNGFVSNPIEILDSFGYDRGVLNELIANEDLLVLPGRSEVFITAYFIHTRFKPLTWLTSPFATYWRGKLYIKENGVASFKPPVVPADPMDKIVVPGKVEPSTPKQKDNWDKILDDLEIPK